MILRRIFCEGVPAEDSIQRSFHTWRGGVGRHKWNCGCENTKPTLTGHHVSKENPSFVIHRVKRCLDPECTTTPYWPCPWAVSAQEAWAPSLFPGYALGLLVPSCCSLNGGWTCTVGLPPALCLSPNPTAPCERPSMNPHPDSSPCFVWDW